MGPVYLDYNASTPLDPRVVDAMLPWLRDGAGNPSSRHVWGRQARDAVETARRHVADLLGCDPDEIVFTSSGSEANNHAIKGTAWARREAGRHLVVSAVEHPAVAEPAAWLAREGWRVTTVAVDADGRLDPDAVRRTIGSDTVLVSVMLANNETGVLQPVAAIAERLRPRQAWLHSDCAQAAGKVPVRVREIGLDLASLAGHKLYAPKGVGALYVRRGLQLENLVHGAGHEAGRRAGTEAVALVVAFGEACRLAAENLAEESQRLAGLRDDLAARLRALAPGVVVHGERVPRLPNTLSIAFPGRRALAVLAALEDRLAASPGAACHGADGRVSGVLAAMGVSAEIARATMRLTVGRFTTVAEVARAADMLRAALDQPDRADGD
ncbi:MAG TPA: cysteine desulfurase family protein [Candidatus Krumholzibacteria bacterium]|nr:cysteine desulfurase family protein [Candidatus Krumholzibacteria bacterium]HPD71026.1 cysteine desulfurase family protein [Candidatus Krumholzibacteria bacterium]HRY39274.1 cysteine desulfurase family protein [Candidatus Krumholzibacteria bacterium]